MGIEFENSQISNEALEQFHEWLIQKDYAPATVARKWAAVRSFLTYLKDERILLDTSLGDHLQVEQVEREQPRILSQREMMRLLDSVRVSPHPIAMRDSGILALMYEFGLRASETVDIQLEDLDLERGLLRTPQGKKSFAAFGTVYESLVAYLQNGRPHLAKDPQERALFINQRGKGLTRQGLWLVIKRRAREAGLGGGISPHTIRHSLIQHMLDEGISKREIQRRLGLRSPNSLRIFRNQAEGVVPPTES
jgi:integrase/recombinase XerD